MGTTGYRTGSEELPSSPPLIVVCVGVDTMRSADGAAASAVGVADAGALAAVEAGTVGVLAFAVGAADDAAGAGVEGAGSGAGIGAGGSGVDTGSGVPGDSGSASAKGETASPALPARTIARIPDVSERRTGPTVPDRPGSRRPDTPVPAR